VQPLLCKKAFAYIEQRAQEGKPFFLYFPLAIPHGPNVPAPEFKDKGGWLGQGDWIVGQIMELLERHKISENTLLIVTSDNGGGTPPGMRGSKGSPYEGGHRVPFVARWPGKIKPGTVCDDTICLNDLMATCAEIVGAKLPTAAGPDSVSILPDLLGTATGPVREATVHESIGGDLAIRQGPWKLIFFRETGQSREKAKVFGKPELYNLKEDLAETNNVLANNPEVVERLSKLMRQYIDTGRSTPGDPIKTEVEIRLP
jgi:arylsulfatase A